VLISYKVSKHFDQANTEILTQTIVFEFEVWLFDQLVTDGEVFEKYSFKVPL